MKSLKKKKHFRHRPLCVKMNEWIFFATSHGKSPCDGIGGTLKRVAYQESLKQVTK